jgi:outer membrane biosynthesis protein TonB
MNATEMTPTFSPEDLFLRDSDRERLAMSYNVLVTKRQSLLMISDSDVLLEHYGRMLIRMLRETTDVEVEVFFPSSTDALIQRFNDILAPLSVEDAMATQGPVLPARVLVMHDAVAVQRQQVELLARLVNDFPGANVRLVMLMNTSADVTPDLSSFGKRTSRWTIEKPSVGAADAFIDKASLQGQEGAARALIDRLGIYDVSPEPELPEADFADMDLSPTDPPLAAGQRRRRWLIILLVPVLLVLSALLVLSLYPKHRDAAMQMLWPTATGQAAPAVIDPFKDDAPAPVPTPATAEPAEPAEPTQATAAGESAEPAQSAATLPAVAFIPSKVVPPLPGILPPWADVRTDVQMSRELRNLSDREAAEKFLPDARRLWVDDRFKVNDLPPPATVAAADAAPAPAARPEEKPIAKVEPKAEPKPEPRPEAKPPAPPKAPPPPPQPAPVTNTPATANASASAANLNPDDRLGHNWVNGQPERYWVLQYTSVVSADQARDWIAAHPKLERLHAVAVVKKTGLPHYVVVYGAFKNREEAQAFATSAESPKEYWARSIKSLKGVLRTP